MNPMTVGPYPCCGHCAYTECRRREDAHVRPCARGCNNQTPAGSGAEPPAPAEKTPTGGLSEPPYSSPPVGSDGRDPTTVAEGEAAAVAGPGPTGDLYGEHLAANAGWLR